MEKINKLTSLPVGKAVPSSSSGLAVRSGSSSSTSSNSSASRSNSSLGRGFLGFLGSIGSGVLSYINARRSEKYQKSLLDEQRKQFLEDRQHDEEYNSPANMLARLRLAGISPTSLSNVPTTDSSGGQISADANSVTNSRLAAGQSLQNGFSSALDALALDKQKAEIDKLYSDVASASADRDVKSLNSAFLRSSLADRVAQEKFKSLSEEMELSRLRADINRIVGLTGLTASEKKQRDLSYRLSVDTYDAAVKLARFQADNSELEFKIKDYDLTKVMPAQLMHIYEQTNQIRQSTYLSYAYYVNESEKLSSYIGQVDEQTKSLKFSNDAMQETFDQYVENLQNTYKLTDTEAKFAAAQQWMKIIGACTGTIAATAAAAIGLRKGGRVANGRVQDSGVLSNYGYSSFSSWDYPMNLL